MHSLATACLFDICSIFSLIIVYYTRLCHRVVYSTCVVMKPVVVVLRSLPIAHARGSGFYEVFRSLAVPELDDGVQIQLYLLMLRYNQALFFSQTAQPASDMRSAFARSVAQDSGTLRLACASKSLKQSGSRCKVLLRTMMQQ